MALGEGPSWWFPLFLLWSKHQSYTVIVSGPAKENGPWTIPGRELLYSIVQGYGFFLSCSLWRPYWLSFLYLERCSMCHCQLNLQPATPKSAVETPWTSVEENNPQECLLFLFLSLCCSITCCFTWDWSQVPRLLLRGSSSAGRGREGKMRDEGKEEHEQLCLDAAWCSSPSWGCCKFSVEISTLSTE